MITSSSIFKDTERLKGSRRTGASVEEEGVRPWARATYDLDGTMQDRDEIASLFLSLGETGEKLEEFGEAASNFKSSYEMVPCADVAYQWARCALAAGDYEGAQEAIMELASIDPLTPRKASRKRSNRKTTAIKGIEGPPNAWVQRSPFYQGLLRDMRKDAALLAEIGHFYERKVDDVSLAQAAACYQHAFELAPSSDLAFYWTRAALQSGDYEDGKHALRELEAIDPRRSRSVFLRQHPTMLRGYGGEVGRAIFRGLDREPEKKATKFLLDERGSPNECRKKKLDDLPVFKQDQNNVNGLPRQR